VLLHVGDDGSSENCTSVVARGLKKGKQQVRGRQQLAGRDRWQGEWALVAAQIEGSTVDAVQLTQRAVGCNQGIVPDSGL
jgi:hypothetical protein